LPAPEAAFAVELIHAGHQVAGEHGRDGTAGMEDTRSLSELFLSIPRSDDVLHAWIESALSKADKEA